MADLHKRRCTIGRLALRLAKAKALPYWSIVVETGACRISFVALHGCASLGQPRTTSVMERVKPDPAKSQFQTCRNQAN